MKEKNLYEIATERGIKTFKELGDFINGRKLKTIKPAIGLNVSGHNYKAKFIGYVPNKLPATGIVLTSTFTAGQISKSTDGNNSIYLYELSLDSESKDDLIEELKRVTDKFEEDSNNLKERIHILEENGLDEYDEKLITIIKALNNFEFKKELNMDKVSIAKILCNII